MTATYQRVYKVVGYFFEKSIWEGLFLWVAHCPMAETLSLSTMPRANPGKTPLASSFRAGDMSPSLTLVSASGGCGQEPLEDAQLNAGPAVLRC